jgi:hypothetical protein
MNPLDLLLNLLVWIGVIAAFMIAGLLVYIAIALPISLIRSSIRKRRSRNTVPVIVRGPESR